MRFGRIGGLAALAAGLVISSAVAATISFRDASFEVPAVQRGSFTYYRAGEVLDSAWTVGGGGATLFNTYVHDGVTYNAQSGDQFVALGGPSADDRSGSVTYSLTAEPNVDYQYSFYVGNAPSNLHGATVNVWTIINGFTPQRPLPVTNSNVTAHGVNWQRFTGSFRFTPQDIGGASSTTVLLKFENGVAGGGFVGLDSFSVAPCPGGLIQPACGEPDGGGVRPGPPSPWR
jgi:hypothetical protein